MTNTFWTDHTFNHSMPDPKAIRKAFEAIPPPPCETFNCPNYKKCAEQKLACETFVRYVARGVAPDTSLMRKYTEKPTREIFDRLHPADDE